MAGPRNQRFAYASLAALLVAFVAAVIASNTLLRGMRLDLTENNLYTLAPGTREMLREIPEPINLYYFFSEESTSDAQALRAYATRVEEVLDEFVAAAGGQLRLQTIDPAPFSEDEDRAAQFGLTDLGLGSLGGEAVYFGLAATNSVGDEGIVEVFDPARESSLEYDLARLVYGLSTPEKSVIGLISGVNIGGGFDAQSQQMLQPWIMNQQIQQLFDVRSMAADFSSIDEDINTLWIVHPTGLSANALYAIDQFVLAGGRALVFVDPLAEAAAMTANPAAMASSSSNLPQLFTAWGIDYDPTMVVADNRYALSVTTGAGRPIRHIGLLGLDQEAMAADELVSADLASINLGTAGSLSPASNASSSFVPLLESSTDSGLIPAGDFQLLADPLTLLDSLETDEQTHVLAARIEGPIVSAFPDGPPGEDAGLLVAPESHLTNAEASNLIVVTDVDILSDRLWVQRQRGLLGGEMLTAFASNGDFVANALALLSGSEQLIGLKSRQTYVRPFDLVEQLQREAEERYRETEQRLQSELAATEQRLVDLQQTREDQGSLFMNSEQQRELDRFREEQLRIRQELRSVQHELNSSIDELGALLKLLNIFLVPAGIALLAVAAYLFRRSRKRTAPK